MADQKLRDFIQHQLSGLSAKQYTIIERSFHNDYAVFDRFFVAIFQVSLEGERYPYRPERPPVGVLLRFPYMLGADPAEEDTVDWVREFFGRYSHIWKRDGDARIAKQEEMLRSARKLYKAGVPLDYLRAYHPEANGTPIPVNDIIAAWRNGLAPEYALMLRELA
jgi:hypothetical protein